MKIRLCGQCVLDLKLREMFYALFLSPSQIDHPRLGLPVNASMQWLQQCSCAEVVLLTCVMALTIPTCECIGSTSFVMYFKCHACLGVESKTIVWRGSVGRALDHRCTDWLPSHSLTHTDLRCNNCGSAQRSVSHGQQIKCRAATCTCVLRVRWMGSGRGGRHRGINRSMQHCNWVWSLSLR